MDRRQYEYVRQIAEFPTLSVDEVGTDERTLMYGYRPNGDKLHVYVYDGELHVYVYKTSVISPGVTETTEILHRHGHVLDTGVLLDIGLVRPQMRAHPERTEAHFARLMAERGAKIAFTAFNDEVHADTQFNDFHGKVF